MKTKSYILDFPCSAEEIVGITGECELVVSMRLHSIIYATGMSVPAIALSYDPKVSGFVKYIGASTVIDVNDYKEGMISSQTEKIISEGKLIKEKLSDSVEEFRKKAEENAKMAIELIEN